MKINRERKVTKNVKRKKMRNETKREKRKKEV